MIESNTMPVTYGINSARRPAARLIAAIIMVFFTRETTGVLLRRDWALVSRKSCNLPTLVTTN